MEWWTPPLQDAEALVVVPYLPYMMRGQPHPTPWNRVPPGCPPKGCWCQRGSWAQAAPGGVGGAPECPFRGGGLRTLHARSARPARFARWMGWIWEAEMGISGVPSCGSKRAKRASFRSLSLWCPFRFPQSNRIRIGNARSESNSNRIFRPLRGRIEFESNLIRVELIRSK